MFIKLLHGLQSVLGKYLQKWTKDSLPAIVMTKHDFEDGLGNVPAVPMDEPIVTTDVTEFVEETQLPEKMAVKSEVVNFCEESQLTDKINTRCDITDFCEESQLIDKIDIACNINDFIEETQLTEKFTVSSDLIGFEEEAV